MILSQVKYVKIQIQNQLDFMDEHYLFSCDRLKKDCLYLAVEFFLADSNGVIPPILPLTSSIVFWEVELDKEDNLSCYNFEDFYLGKGLIKSGYPSNVFIITLTEGKKKYFVRCSTSYQKRWKISMNGYAASLFINCLRCSQKYVEHVTNHFCKKYLLHTLQGEIVHIEISKFNIKLKEANYHVMDLKWAKMVCTTVYEMCQLQYAMSWLSTLGGAYSALGEDQEKCALNAGRISVKQLRIGLRLGDKIMVAQCKLYFSLSLIQRGQCRLAKKILLEQYSELKSSNVVDRKTINMCKGIWARLKYELFKRRMAKEKLLTLG